MTLLRTKSDIPLPKTLEEAQRLITEINRKTRIDLDAIDGGLSSAQSSITALQALFGADSVHAVTADYAILDNDGYMHIVVDSRTGDKTITLPTLSANQGRVITVSVAYAGGKVTVDGEGAELVDEWANINLQSQYDHVMVVGTATCWMVLKCRCLFDTGWIKTNDESNRHFGNVLCTYDTLSGVFLAGEVLQEYSDSGRTTPTAMTGIIQSDSGTALILKNVTGGGNFTNNYYLKGLTSLATAMVNVSTKNVDSLTYHYLNRKMSLLHVRHFWSTDGTEGDDKAFELPLSCTDSQYTNHQGHTMWSINGDLVVRIRGGTTSLAYLASASGNITQISSSDYYYKNLVYYIK